MKKAPFRRLSKYAVRLVLVKYLILGKTLLCCNERLVYYHQPLTKPFWRKRQTSG